MLYPKFKKRYLAVVVCFLILLLGISTLVLAYSFYMHRSPLLVKNLENVIVSGQMKSKHILKSKAAHSKNGFNESTEQNAIDFRRYPTNRGNASKESYISNIPYWRAKNNNETETDLDDTIYIDDFERNKTNIFTSEKPSVSDDVLPRYTESQSSPNTLIPILVHVQRSSSNDKTGRRNMNLDSVYDRIRDSDEGMGLGPEDGDDADDDDLSTYGSGSGNFEVSSLTSDELPEYDISASKYFSEDMKNYDWKLRFNSKKYEKIYPIENGRNKAASQNSALSTKDNKNKKPKLKKIRPTIPKGKNFGGIQGSFDRKFGKNFNEKRRRMKSRLVKSSEAPEPVIGSFKEENRLQNNNNFNNNDKKNKNKSRIPLRKIATTIKATTQAAAAASVVSKNKLMKSTLRSREDLIEPLPERHHQIQKPTLAPDLAVGSEMMKPEAKQPNLPPPPPTWTERRTRLFASRRALGNARKSEERSRQLLLCEEAGGGELCEMLFKGHTNE